MKFSLFILLCASQLIAQATMSGTGQGVGTGQMGILPLPVQYSLTVAVTGVGTVTASPNGVGGIAISCPPSCVANYNTGTVVTLTETPGGGQTFSTWGGACAGSATTCPLTISANTSVTAAFTGSSGGGPTSYAARTDTCYFNATYAASCSGNPTCAAVCNPALTVGEQVGGLGALLSYTEGNSDPLPFTTIASGTANQNNSFTDPDFGTYEVWLTDQTPANMNNANAARQVVSMGSAGGYDAFNQDSTLISTTNSNGVQFMWHIIPSRFHTHTCTPANPCIVVSNIAGSATPDSTHFDNNATALFPRNPSDGNNVMFEIAPTYIKKLTLTIGTSGGIPTGVDSIARTTIVDFTSDTPVPCSVLPPGYLSTWSGQTTMSNTDTFTMASGGGAPWPAKIGNAVGNGSQAVTADNFTLPTNNLSITSTVSSISGVAGTVTLVTTGTPMTAYVNQSVTIAGTTNYNGSYTLLTINNSTHTYTFTGPNAATETAGTAKVALVSSMMFQVTTAGTTAATGSEPNWIRDCPLVGMTCTDNTAIWTNIGKVAGQAPGFDVMNYRPGIGCSRINTRLMKMYRGTGDAEPAGQMQTDDATVYNQMTGSNCGAVGGTCGTVSLPDRFTLHDPAQMLDARYASLSPTGGGSVNNNWGGSGSNLTALGNGSCTPPVSAGGTSSVFPNWPSSVWVSGFAYTKAGLYAVDPTDHNYYKTLAAVTSTTQPHSDAANWKYESSYCYNYTVEWATNMIRPCLELGPDFGCDGHRANGYQYFYQGGKFWAHSFGTVNCQTNVNCPAPFIGPTGYVGGPSPGFQLSALGSCSDLHGTYRNVGTTDLQPVFFATSSVPSWPTGYTCPSYNEELAYAIAGTTGYRFGHNWNTGSNPGFGTQNAVGVVSQLGDILAVSTDGMNTRGDKITGATTCAHPLRAQYFPSAPQTVTVNDTVLPISNNSNQSIYQVTGISTDGGITWTGTTGTYAAPIPAWNSCQTVGCLTYAPSTGPKVVRFQSLGPNTCRGDVFLMDVTSSHIAP